MNDTPAASTPSASTPATSRTPPGHRAGYRRFMPITLRWMDNDVFGHVNNVHYYSFFDTAVCSYLVEEGVLHYAGSEYVMMVAESGCRYHSEVAYPGRIEAGLRVARIGRSSVRYEIGIFRDGVDLASAEGHFTHVCVGRASKRPAPLPDRWRTVLNAISIDKETV